MTEIKAEFKVLLSYGLYVLSIAVEGNSLREIEIMKKFSRGVLQYC